jgi:uncharacterized membrane protein
MHVLIGTLASAGGGAIIGLTYYIFTLFHTHTCPQYPVILFSLVGGFLGSMIDSLLGATLQATYYSQDKNVIIRTKNEIQQEKVVCICGMDILSNEAVNFLSILLTMIILVPIVPYIFY